MKRYHKPRKQVSTNQFAAFLVCYSFLVLSVQPCTIFVLTDTKRVLFCNNEDWSNPKARIWFVPGDARHYGAVYVGFDDGFAQGGLNSQGLASDWVAGSKETWNPDPKLPFSAGNRQLLETCATVEEAIDFFGKHRELGFYTARILVADRTGASAIIGAKEGKLFIDRAGSCRGFGYGAATLDKMLKKTTEPTIENGAKILRTARQHGQYATKYSNIFDLKNGDIFLFPFPERDDQVKFNLEAELKKGGHYYDMAAIHEQLAQAPRPLLANMERSALDNYQPIPDKEPQVTARVRALWQDILDDTMRADDYTVDSWKEVTANREQGRATIKSLGRLVSVTLVERSEEGGKRCYRYRVEFENNAMLQRLVFDDQNKVISGPVEDIR